MKSPTEIFDYSQEFIDNFIDQILPIYDLWSVHPAANSSKLVCNGSSGDTERFRQFFEEHAETSAPFPLIVVVGNASKADPARMIPNTRQKSWVKFDVYKGRESDHSGVPWGISGMNPQEPSPLNVFGLGGMTGKGYGGFSLSHLQGIIDKNVSDAAKTLEAQYREMDARREIDSLKKIAELETKLELYKLEVMKNEFRKESQKRQEELEEMQNSLMDEYENITRIKEEGITNTKDYVNAILSGALEFGKGWLGIEEPERKEDRETREEEESTTHKNQKPPRFEEVQDEESGTTLSGLDDAPEEEEEFNLLIEQVKGMDPDRMMILMGIIMEESGLGEEAEEEIDPIEDEDAKVAENENSENQQNQ